MHDQMLRPPQRIQIIVENVAMLYENLTPPIFLPLLAPSPPPSTRKKRRQTKHLSSAHSASAQRAAALPHRVQATNVAAETGSVVKTVSASAPPPALASAGQERRALL